MNPLFRIDFSISDSLKIVRKSVLIYETIIGHGFAVKGFFKTIRNQYLVNNMMKYVVNHSCSESLHRYLINGMLIRLIKRDMDGWLRWKTNNYC